MPVHCNVCDYTGDAHAAYGRECCDRLREHIGALTAERDRLRRACKAAVAAYESHQLYDKFPLDVLRAALAPPAAAEDG